MPRSGILFIMPGLHTAIKQKSIMFLVREEMHICNQAACFGREMPLCVGLMEERG